MSCRCKNREKSCKSPEFGRYCCNDAFQILSFKEDVSVLKVNLKQNACPTLKKTNN
jgi:hypothetical protein